MVKTNNKMTSDEQSSDVNLNLYVYNYNVRIALSQLTRTLRTPGFHHTNIISSKTKVINKTFKTILILNSNT